MTARLTMYRKRAELVAYRPQDLRIRDVQVSIAKSVDDQRWNVSVGVYYETALKIRSQNVEGQFQLTLRTEGGDVVFLSEPLSLVTSSKNIDLIQEFELSVPKVIVGEHI